MLHCPALNCKIITAPCTVGLITSHTDKHCIKMIRTPAIQCVRDFPHTEWGRRRGIDIKNEIYVCAVQDDLYTNCSEWKCCVMRFVP
ncbi:hypothetical protein XENTR_v10019210 [Xenopus tropicalis]|nr:hypothetical protein XENTR_v10019210 [Xenopus tropicalis]